MAGKFLEKFRKKRREFLIMSGSNECPRFVTDARKILVSFLAWDSIFGGYNGSAKADGLKARPAEMGDEQEKHPCMTRGV